MTAASAPSPPTWSSLQGLDRDLIRRRLELLLRESFGIEHTTLQMEEEASQDLLHVENAPHARSRSRVRRTLAELLSADPIPAPRIRSRNPIAGTSQLA